jgi:hypothetical protein
LTVLNAIARIAGARLIVAGIVAVTVAVGGFFFRDIISGSVLDLRVGDCFDLPTGGGDTVYDVQHHRCTEPHTAELIGLLDYPAGNDGFPGQSALEAFATSGCVNAFRTYTGRNPYNDTELTVGWLLPSPDGWDHGDHVVSCHLLRVDDGVMTQSYRVPQ